MRTAIVWALGLLVLGLPASRVRAGFSSLYVFGDGACTTTSRPYDTILEPYYYGRRYCNGRVWVEVLAQWQGVGYDEANNNSFFGHDSVDLLVSVDDFVAPPDVSTALFVVWANDADFVGFMSGDGIPYNETNLPAWTTFIGEAIANHELAITNLHAKGMRTVPVEAG